MISMNTVQYGNNPKNIPNISDSINPYSNPVVPNILPNRSGRNHIGRYVIKSDNINAPPVGDANDVTTKVEVTVTEPVIREVITWTLLTMIAVIEPDQLRNIGITTVKICVYWTIFVNVGASAISPPTQVI